MINLNFIFLQLVTAINIVNPTGMKWKMGLFILEKKCHMGMGKSIARKWVAFLLRITSTRKYLQIVNFLGLTWKSQQCYIMLTKNVLLQLQKGRTQFGWNIMTHGPRRKSFQVIYDEKRPMFQMFSNHLDFVYVVTSRFNVMPLQLHTLFLECLSTSIILKHWSIL